MITPGMKEALAEVTASRIANQAQPEPQAPLTLESTLPEEKPKSEEPTAAENAVVEAKAQKDLEASNKLSIEQKERQDAEKNKPKEKDKAPVVEDLESVPEFDAEDLAYMETLKESPKDIKAEGNEAPKSKGAKKESTDEDFAPYREKASAYEEIISDPLTKAFIDFRKNGGNDIGEFIKQAGIVDVNSMTPEQLYHEKIKDLGLTEDEYTEAMENFGALPKVEKLSQVKETKKELTQAQNEKLTTFSAGVNKNAEAENQFMTQAISKGTKELGDALAKMEGKKYNGLLVTPEMANNIKDYVSLNTVPILDEHKKFVGYDIKESIRRAVAINYDKELRMIAHKMGKTLGFDEAMKTRQRPNRNDTPSAIIPHTTKSKEEKLQTAADSLWEQRGVRSSK